ncbi:APC family permease [Ktedonosporobacter rubrisoli]|uniref:APC family permease n=1 Tax=Ktedonosporobacter rubrisoli TaxID=2509675 RepID=A0A4P6K4E1_KTERU|nr:APC family permease [Ktedonosporobacter rubrisoli]QBD83054.1 APC family permease [Ktedonosporobacter rubrisoli]
MSTFSKSSRQNSDLALTSEQYVPKTMPQIFGQLDLTATYLVIVFFINNSAGAATSGPAALIYWTLGAVAFFIPCAVVTAQLGTFFPFEGSLYNWTHKVLGGYWSFFIGFCAWLPGILVIESGANIFTTFLQGIHQGWLSEPWQQGLVIISVIALSGIIACQRARTVQNIINVAVGLIGLVVFTIGVACIWWLVSGHHSATNFADAKGWLITWQDPQTANISQFGIITLAYLGTEIPLIMGGEIAEHKVISRHILWGTILTLIGYFISTIALLVVKGTNVSPFDLVSLVDTALTPLLGNIVVICILCFFLIIPIVYNLAFARLLMVAAIDARLPAKIGLLNKHRVPANAIFFQTIVAIIIASITYFLAPYFFHFANPTDLSFEVFNISQAGATLVWAIPSAFLFVCLSLSFLHDRQAFHQKRILPLPVLLICSIVGPLACIAAIVDTLLNSWIPQLISSIQWWYIVGSVTLICLIIAAVGSMFASSEAEWQTLEEK